MFKIPPYSEIILLGVGGILVFADLRCEAWSLPGILATVISAIILIAIFLVIWNKKGEFFSGVAVPAIVGLLKRKTDLDLSPKDAAELDTKKDLSD